MSRSGYSDDCENLQLYRQAVDRAMGGARGQAFLRELRDALDALPTKRLIVDAFSEQGEVCALGSIDPTPNVHADDIDCALIGRHFGIATAMAAEIMFVNDEGTWGRPETPEERWTRVRAWTERHLDKAYD